MPKHSTRQTKEQAVYLKKRLDTEDYLIQLIIYTHLNPKKHFGSNFEHYRFSSYRAVLSKKPSKIKRKEILDLFDGKENFEYVHNHKKIEIEKKLKLEQLTKIFKKMQFYRTV